MEVYLTRCVTEFADGHAQTQKLDPPLQHPDAVLVRIDIDGLTVTHWWQATVRTPKVKQLISDVSGNDARTP